MAYLELGGKVLPCWMASLVTTPTSENLHLKKEDLLSEIETLGHELGDLQEKLFAQRKYAVLVVLQGLDGSGKDNTVKHVFGHVSPAGCRVKSFKVPTEEEQAHDFLWRVHKECPELGMIQVFNRSHYEDVMVPVVSDNLKESELKKRYQQINAFEQLLIDHNTLVFKFFLHVGAAKQKERLADRRVNPEKLWKYDAGDEVVFAEREKWLKQFDEIIKHCSEPSPWVVVPADDRPTKNLLILRYMLKSLKKLSIDWPS
jgi:PPK2 family polyphosphate:nucleotide phosphotransferase